MLLREDLLTIAKRNVEQGRQLVERQRLVVHRRQLAGLDVTLSEDVFNMFERSLAKCEDELARQSSRPPVTASNRIDLNELEQNLQA